MDAGLIIRLSLFYFFRSSAPHFVHPACFSRIFLYSVPSYVPLSSCSWFSVLFFLRFCILYLALTRYIHLDFPFPLHSTMPLSPRSS